MKHRKVKISKYDTWWSLLVRTRDNYRCQVCGKRDMRENGKYMQAHHRFGRGKKTTRLMIDNGITLCTSHHTFNNDFSAHKTPKDFKDWWDSKYPDRLKKVQPLSEIVTSEKEAIRKFIEEYPFVETTYKRNRRK